MNPSYVQPSPEPTHEAQILTCAYCHARFMEHELFLHEATGEKLCQKDLVYYLRTDIQDSEDECGVFQGFYFERSEYPYGHFEASRRDGDVAIIGSLEECVEGVLSKLELI